VSKPYLSIRFEKIVIKSFLLGCTDPFKFDVPSPDDVVFTGLHSSKKGLKGIPPSIYLSSGCNFGTLAIT
jgi:hypothetical protein